MIESLITLLGTFVIRTIESTGYAGIAVLMALESANIPIPSEVIMPFSGYLVFEGKFTFLWVIFWGAAGNLVGSLVSYYLGFFGGRAFLERYGKFLFITTHDLDLADRLFQKYGTSIILISRVLPILRTFISFPAGIAKMNIWKFSLYTFGGSFLWSYALTYAGVIAGQNWRFLEHYFRSFDWLIAIVLVVGAIWWVRRHIMLLRKERNEQYQSGNDNHSSV